jgi:hypothetical protein
MNWIDELLDRLALKLAIKVRAELDGAIDAALDRADDRIDTALEGLETRLLAAAAKPIADLNAAVAVITYPQQVVDVERFRGEVCSEAAKIQQQAHVAAMEAAIKPDLALEPQLQSAAEMVGTTPAEAAKLLRPMALAAGMISAEEGRAQMNAAADAAMAVARDHLLSRLTPPRPWKEIPDR